MTNHALAGHIVVRYLETITTTITSSKAKEIIKVKQKVYFGFDENSASNLIQIDFWHKVLTIEVSLDSKRQKGKERDFSQHHIQLTLIN